MLFLEFISHHLNYCILDKVLLKQLIFWGQLSNTDQMKIRVWVEGLFNFQALAVTFIFQWISIKDVI